MCLKIFLKMELNLHNVVDIIESQDEVSEANKHSVVDGGPSQYQTEVSQPQHLNGGDTTSSNRAGTSVLRTCFNGINVLSGVGILSTPHALSQGGWLSLFPLLLVAILCWFTGVLLQRCMNTDPRIKTYPDIGEHAFGYKGRLVVSTLLYVELYLVSVEFLILGGDNLDKLFPNMGIQVGGLRINGTQTFVLLSALVVLPTTWLKSLGLLAYLSATGVLSSFVLLVCLIWVGAIDGVGFNQSGDLINWRGMPMTLSVFTFCYCGHAVFPTLLNSMQNRNKFPKVLFVCFITSSINYGSMAVLGYLMYGEHLRSLVTLNLPTKQISTKVAIVTALISPLAKYAIVIAPIATAIEENPFFLNRNIGKRVLSISIRTVIVISTVVVALTIPFFDDVMELIGSFFSVALSIVLPCLCYLKTTNNNAARNFRFELIVIVVILVFGGCIAVVGTFTSIQSIVRKLLK